MSMIADCPCCAPDGYDVCMVFHLNINLFIVENALGAAYLNSTHQRFAWAVASFASQSQFRLVMKIRMLLTTPTYTLLGKIMFCCSKREMLVYHSIYTVHYIPFICIEFFHVYPTSSPLDTTSQATNA
mmetsp:Transcript_21354/g.33516  ORF Transcript_21354/g.33516 Transcript_21354/m.33516 type:complete len:128 (-) Transcript_21354:1138-1521(-)